MVFETDGQAAKQIRFMLMLPEPQVHHPAPSRIIDHTMNNDQPGAEQILRLQLQQATLAMAVQQ